MPSLPDPSSVLISELTSLQEQEASSSASSEARPVLAMPVTINSFQRMQIHQFIEVNFKALHTFSVGEEGNRRMVVVCRGHLQEAKKETQQLPRKPVEAPAAARPAGRGVKRPSRGVYVPPGRQRLINMAGSEAKPPPGMNKEQVAEVKAKLGGDKIGVKFEPSRLDVIPGERLTLSMPRAAVPEPQPRKPVSAPAAPAPTANGENVLEVHSFPADFKTSDVCDALRAAMSGCLMYFELRWVDDTHALAVFDSAAHADCALRLQYNSVSVRALAEGLPQSREKAESQMLLQRGPAEPREAVTRNEMTGPQTSTVVARRMLTGALGKNFKMPEEQEKRERQNLKEAKEQKRLASNNS